LVGGKKHRTFENKTLELYVIPALKEALLIDSGRGFLEQSGRQTRVVTRAFRPYDECSFFLLSIGKDKENGKIN